MRGELSRVVWWVGAHGGAGESTLEQLLSGSRAADHAWPISPDPARPAATMLVARTSYTGLRAAQRALCDWGSGSVVVDLLGLVLIADAPGKLPKELRGLVDLIDGAAPGTTWLLPWQADWRLGQPCIERASRPLQTAASPQLPPGGPMTHVVLNLIAAVPNPGQGSAPPGSDKLLTILRWAAWGTFAVCVAGVLLSGGYRALAAQLLKDRRAASLPPFGQLALLRAEAKDKDALDRFLASAAATANDAAVVAHGPLTAPMARRAGAHRGQVLIEAGERAALQGFLPAWLDRVRALPGARQLRWSIDVDPVDLY